MKRRILCLILVFATLCSFNLTMAFADTRNNQISKSYIGRFRSGWDELTIYDISGNKIRFHVFFYRLHDQYSTATLASDGAAYFSAPSDGGFSGKLEFIGGSVILSIDDTYASKAFFGTDASTFLGGKTHWFSRAEFSATMLENLPYYKQVYFSSAVATSEYRQGDILFKAEYAIDSINRPWVEDDYGSGIGETLSLYFKKPTTIQELSFRLGYARDQARWEKNNRPSKLRLSFSDGRWVDCSFFDRNREQLVLLSEAVTTDVVHITILEVYAGKEWDDTCIYEVKAYCP